MDAKKPTPKPARKRASRAKSAAKSAPKQGTLPALPAAPKDLPEPQLTDNAATVLANRYLAKDKLTGEVAEEPRDLFWRVAAAVAAPEYDLDRRVGERWARRYYELMSQGTFVPNSPTLMNAGRDMGMLSACFVLPVEDSIDGIFTTLKHVALIQKAGGGTGFSFARLRPEGDLVASSGGRTSGPLSFIDTFSAGTESIQQGAFRRGANMGVMRCDHPDVVEFIRAKDDLSRWTNYNVSVAVTEEWMQKVMDAPSDPVLINNPRSGQKAWLKKTEGRRISEADYESYAAGAPADDAQYWTYGEVMDRIIHFAWKNGEPGMLFIDRANADNQVPNLGDYEATNPCVPADTWVQTVDGPRMVGELVGRGTEVVVHGAAWQTGEQGFFSTGRKPVLELKTEFGPALKLTANHPVRKVTARTRWRLETEWVDAGDLQPGDEVQLHNHRSMAEWQGVGSAEEGYLLGLLTGDGTLKKECAVLSVWAARPTADGTIPTAARGVITEAERCAATLNHRSDFRGFSAVSDRGEWRLQSAPLRDLAARFDMRPGAKMPGEEVERTSSHFHAAYLRGLFDADGSVQGNTRKGLSVRLAQSDRVLLERCQRMLLRLGVQSKLYARRAEGEALLPDGNGGQASYPTKAQFELVIANDNLHVFAERVGFADTSKQSRLEVSLASLNRAPNRERFVATVQSIEPAGEMEVFDVQVPGVNAFDANGLMVHNCGEQWLLPYGSCNLGSINLGKFYRPHAPEAADWQDRIDWDEFETAVADCTRFLDDVVTINNYPIEEIRERANEERRIGLGVMGFADLLFQLGVRYGSEKSFEIARVFSERLTEGSYKASEALVEEDGRAPFLAWQGSKPQVDGRKPRRNSHVSTVAPTGTISIIAGCSGGIEPIFSLAFQRQVMKNADGVPVIMREVQPDFREALEKRGYSEHEIDAVIDVALTDGTVAGSDLPTELKTTFVTARDVVPQDHILMQAAWQSKIDNAVSKTINLPHEASEDDVRTAYLLAWREGCKGVTVYRDGCREMQPMALKDKEEAPTAPVGDVPIAPVRLPEIMPSIRVRQMTPFGNMHVKISVDAQKDREMEVFAQLGKGGDVANSDLEAICRMLSLFLRCGGATSMALKQLEGIGSSLSVPSKEGRIMSLADGLAKALQKYLQAKAHHGLRAILLGEVDPEDLSEAPAGNAMTAAPSAGARAGSGMGNAFKIKCPACDGGTLTFEEGCCKCHSCGYSQC